MIRHVWPACYFWENTINIGERGPPIDSPASRDERIRRSKSLSQNFLRDSRLIESLIVQSGITPDDTVLEIGAGTGCVTRSLANHCRRVLAIEKDPQLVRELERTLRGLTNVELIAGDFLDLDLPGYRYKVFASIPYSLTAAIVRKLTSSPRSPAASHLVVQTEAAYKFMGVPRESLHAVLLKPWFRLGITHSFNRRDFRPAPSVDSVLLRIDKRERPLLASSMECLYRDFVVYCFVHGRTLSSTLERLVGPQSMRAISTTLQFPRDVTPTIIDFAVWLCLFREYVQHGSPLARLLIAGSELCLKNEQALLLKDSHPRKRAPQVRQ